MARRSRTGALLAPVAESGADWQPQKGDAGLVVALARGAAVADAAAEAGVSERTAWRRVADPAFRRCVFEAQAELVSRSLGRLSDAAAKAVDTLVELLDADDARARSAAAKAILDYALPMQERFTKEAAALRPRRDTTELPPLLFGTVPVGPAELLPDLLGAEEEV